ncbi:MAG: universal stress protein, partial [Deltaproteobacteria bacterium]|nr:universal stress protein [Deltaproteobacteria bacterium]
DMILEAFEQHCQSHSITPTVKRQTGIISNIISDEAKRSDLVIVAQRGEHAQWSTGLLGSTAESVVRKAPRPVLVTPNEFRKIKNILIAYDGSVESNKALKTVCENFAMDDNNLSVVFVTQDENRNNDLQNEVCEFVNHYKIDVGTVWLQGEAGKEILHYADTHNIDLIVMGAFGHSRIHDLILGGTTAYIIRQSTIPILLNR